MTSTIADDTAFIYDVNKIINGINYDSAAQSLLEKYDVVRRADNKECYIYTDGVYRPYGWDNLERALYETYGGVVQKNGQSVIDKKTINEILSRVFSLKTVDPYVLENNLNFLNVRNGIVDMDSRTLQEHSPEIYSFSQIDVKYDPNAECPNFLNFLDEMVEQKYKCVIQELFGYVLWPEYNINKAFMLLGPKRSGKSTMLNVLSRMLGRESISNASLQDLTEKRFTVANLFGKSANICGDLPRKVINDQGIFKRLTGEDNIQAEYKFKNEFSFMNTAKLIFSANEIPALKYEDDAYYGRWVIIPFDNSVYGREDTQLLKRLTTDNELSGILNWALDGLDRLKDNEWQFSYSDDSIAIYRRKSNPVIAFLEDCCEEYEGYVLKSDLMMAYNRWAKSHNLPPSKSRKSFGQIIIDQNEIPVETIRPNIDGDRPEAWRGIRLVG